MKGAGFNADKRLEPIADFDWGAIEPNEPSVEATVIELLCWGNTPREIAAMRSVLGIDMRRPVEIARSLGISRQQFNTLRNRAKLHREYVSASLRRTPINKGSARI
jgi:hypothetical protein